MCFDEYGGFVECDFEVDVGGFFIDCVDCGDDVDVGFVDGIDDDWFGEVYVVVEDVCCGVECGDYYG